MRASRFITTVEMHTCGEPFRIVTGGLPRIQGETNLQQRAWLQRDADQFRRALMLEPRGHADMYGGFLTGPVTADADVGVVFMQNADYSPHGAHGISARATAAV